MASGTVARTMRNPFLLLSLLAAAISCTRSPPAPENPCSDPVLFAEQATVSGVDGGLLAAWSPESGSKELSRTLWRAWVDRCALEEIVPLTRDLVRFRTVRAEEAAADGPQFVAMARYLDDWARDAGLGFNTVGANEVWEITSGTGPREILFIAHGDVAPVAKAAPETPDALPPGWKHPPFEMTRDNGRFYGRGTEDDKAPIATVMVLMRSMRRFGIAPRGQIALAIGTAEEHGWDDMRRYAEQTVPARYSISIDASFPMVAAQSGFVRWILSLGENIPSSTAARALPGGPAEIRVREFSGGQFLTQVPGEAWMVLQAGGGNLTGFSPLVSEAVAKEQAHRKERGQPFSISVGPVVEPPPPPGVERPEPVRQIRITVRSESMHSSQADKAHNALWPLASIASRLHVRRDGYGNMLRVVNEFFVNDHHGKKLGLAYQDPMMGPLIVAPTVLRVEDKQIRLSVNMRRPRGPSVDEFRKRLDRALERLQKKVDLRLREAEPAYIGYAFAADMQGTLATTLLDIYREWSDNPEAQAKSIRGGTYGRLFEGAVDFGPALPGKPYTGHKADEYVTVETLKACSSMWAEALLRLQAAPPPAKSVRSARPVPEATEIDSRALKPLRALDTGDDEEPRFPATADGIREAMGYIEYDIRECYDAWLKLGEAINGKIHVHYAIKPDQEDDLAHPQGVEITDSTLQHTAIEGCVANAVTSLDFGLPEGGGELQVTYPLSFADGETDPPP